MATARNRLSHADLIKACDLIRAHESEFKQSKDIPVAIITKAKAQGIALVPNNLSTIEKALGINWIYPPKRKAPTDQSGDIKDLLSQYKDLCELVDKLDVRITKIEKAMQARGWRMIGV